MHRHILIVDDDPGVRSLLGQYMRDNGFITTEASDSNEARKAMQMFVFDLIILDVMLPNESGIDFAKSLREVPSSMAILMLTAMEDAKSRILGLEAGADDYLTKPFEPKELLLRINKLIKRAQDSYATRDVVSFGSIKYSPEKNSLFKNGTAIMLTAQEKKLLGLLLSSSGKVISRDILAEFLSVNARSIDVQIRRLRQKIETSPASPVLLQTVRGKGYLLHADA
jgi:two-component system phosphate regulon response regulator OmpR